MDSFLIHMINDECKFRGKAFCEKLLLKVTECMNELTDDKENDILKLKHESTDDEESTDDQKKIIYKCKSFECSNDSVYTITYKTKDDHYTCTCHNYKYYCAKNNMTCKHIQKIKELDDKNLDDKNLFMCNNGITILQ